MQHHIGQINTVQDQEVYHSTVQYQIVQSENGATSDIETLKQYNIKYCIMRRVQHEIVVQ